MIKNFLSNISISKKLRTIILVTSSIVLLLSAAVFIIYDQWTTRNILLEDMQVTAKMIGKNSESSLIFEDKKAAREILSALEVYGNIVQAGLYDKKGKIFYLYVRGGKYKEAQLPKKEKTSYRFENESLFVFQDIFFKGENIGTIFIESNLDLLKEHFINFVIVVAIVLLGCGLIAFFFGALMQGAITKPVFYLSERMRAVSDKKDYSLRATKYGQDELGDLTDSFNDMIIEIQKKDMNLSDAKNYVDNIINSMSDSFFVITDDGNISSVNQATIDLLGYKKEELEGHPFEMIFEPESNFSGKKLPELIEKDLVQEIDLTYIAKDGEKIPVLFKGSAMYQQMKDSELNKANGKRQLIGIIGAGRDMRERHMLLAELSKSKKELESYSKSLEILVDKRTQELVGTIAELTDSRNVMLSILEDTDEAKKKLEHTLEELKRAQEQLVKAGKLAGIGEMAAGVAHEINNPLTSILGYSQILLKSKKIDTTIKTDVKNIEKESKRCGEIIKSLLNFAKPTPPKKIKTDINEVLKITTKVVEYSIEREKIKVKKNIHGNYQKYL